MPIDSAGKRRRVLVARTGRPVLPAPDGTIDENDRWILASRYRVSQIVSTGPAPRLRVPTIADVLDLRVGQVQGRFRFDVVDASGQRQGSVSPQLVPSISHATGRLIYRNLSLVLPPSETDALDPARDRIAPKLIIAGHEHEPIPWCEFVVGRKPEEIASWGVTWHLNCLDVSSVLDDPIPGPVSWDAGDSIAAFLAEQFLAGYVDRFDIAMPSTYLFGQAGSASTGTSRLLVCRNAAGLAAYGCWAGNDGRMKVDRLPTPGVDDPTLTYRRGPDGNIVAGSLIIDPGPPTAPNRWVVFDQASDQEATRGVYDLPAAAPNSFVALGRRITRKPIPVQGLDPANADAVAEFHARNDRENEATASWTSAVDPRHDTYDLVDVAGTSYLEHTWTARCQLGANMTHEARRIYGPLDDA